MIAFPATGRRRIALRLAKQHERIHQAARVRKANRHTMPIDYDPAARRYVYRNGDPVDRDDPRLRNPRIIDRRYMDWPVL